MKEVCVEADPTYLLLQPWNDIFPGITAGITTKNDGFSTSPFTSLNLGLHVADKEEDVIKNRNKAAEKLAFPLDKWVFAEQVHGTEIAVVTGADSGRGSYQLETAIPKADGLITRESGILLAAIYADCVPLYFMDPVSGWIGIAHAGWRGTVGGMAEKMVQALVREGAVPENIRAAIGPCISAEHYQVDQRIADAIEERFRHQVLKPDGEPHYRLDLRMLNQLYLREAGIREEHLSITELCTYKNEGFFYSHRRDNGKTGRMVGFIGKQVKNGE